MSGDFPINATRPSLAEAPRPAPSNGAASAHVRPGAGTLAAWLLVCCALVFAMVVLGGATRLTGSGLSMVDWEPVSGILPPLSDTGWEMEFERYRDSPEFKKVNAWMSVQDFKRIYWLEYGHRALGRLIGIVFLLPLLYFVVRRRVDRSLAPKLAGVFVLGGLQGLLGWYMVKSGLVDNPHVSQYRLTAHLGVAVVIYAYMLWVALDLLHPRTRPKVRPAGSGVVSAATTLGVLVFVTVLSGGFVAGLKAGLFYSTFPLMAGQLIPAGMYPGEPAYMNLFENVTTVQFNHRLLAIIVVAYAAVLWVAARRIPLSGRARLWMHAAAVMALVQSSLGVAALLLHVPVWLAVTHQGGALVLFTTLVGLNHSVRERAEDCRNSIAHG